MDMKLTCDLCGGVLRTDSGRGVCSCCGITYGQDRLQEKMAQQRLAANPSTPHRSTAAGKKAQKKMKIMWSILALTGVAAFVGGLMESGILGVGSLAVALITLFIFKPWKVYGGNVI